MFVLLLLLLFFGLCHPYGPVTVALTRESGKNGSLMKSLESSSLSSSSTVMRIIELPSIGTKRCPQGMASLKTQAESAEYIVITSPEAAKVLIDSCSPLPPNPRLVAVGKATSSLLPRPSSFIPSKSTGKTLALELPLSPGPDGLTRVLYPCSSQASDDVQSTLTDRGFEVTRIDTYDTVAIPLDKVACQEVDVVTLGSPTAARSWCESTDRKPLAACIGETTAKECERLGWDKGKIFVPERPGLEGWTLQVLRAFEVVSGGG